MFLSRLNFIVHATECIANDDDDDDEDGGAQKS